MKILAISCEQDAGAAVNIDGKIIAAANEERFNREKLYIGFPELSILAVCKKANLEPHEFDYIAISSLSHVSSLDYSNVAFHQKVGEILSKVKLIRRALRSTPFANIVKNTHYAAQVHYRDELIKKLRALGFKQKVFYIDHHTSHACSAYFTSGWDDSLVVTLDGAGDGVCSKVFLPKGSQLNQLHSISFYASPGYYYSYVTNICGFKYGREGKITGLAAYGNPEVTKDIFAKRIKYDPHQMRFVNYGHYFNTEINYLRNVFTNIKKEDIASGIQTYLEELVLAYISDLIKVFTNNKPTKLSLAGGVFANVKLNQRISELNKVEEIYVHPHMGDGGLAVGASFALLMQMGLGTSPYKLENAYLGPQYTDDELLWALSSTQSNYFKSDNPALVMAKAIKEGKVVAYFNGPMEYGPRALGHRSIFVSAKDPSINQSLNERLERSEFMPFAPIVLKERESDYFLDLDSKHNCTKFMTITTNVTNKALKDIPAAVHVDGTARFQTITKEQNPTVHEMLKIHNELTSVPAVINTSFNMHEEPIVESPTQAIECFKQGHLDMLVLGSYVIERQETQRDSKVESISIGIHGNN